MQVNPGSLREAIIYECVQSKKVFKLIFLLYN